MRKLFLLTFFLLSSCSLFQSEDSGRYTKSESVENHLEKVLKEPWTIIKNEGSDFALKNNLTHSFFLFNSSCRKFDASNLNTLATSMLTGLDDLEISQREKIIFQDRDALRVQAQGKLDGVSRFFKILTTQKNNCIYDFVLISVNKKNLESDSFDFNNFIQLIKLN